MGLPLVTKSAGSKSGLSLIGALRGLAIKLIIKMPLQTPRPVPDTSEERKANLDSAIASVRLEGLEPTHSALEIFRRYSDGELALEEMVEEVRALNAREFGPVPVSGD